MSPVSVQLADPEWYSHYGFDRDPFAEGGVHGLFYPGGARQETVEQLQHLARYSDCVLLVTGGAGAGKTATRQHFVAQAGADIRCCVVEAALLDGPEQWLRRVLAGFALRPAGRPELDSDILQLAEFCAARTAAGTRCWLVIDDAQDLHEDVMAILAQVLGATGRNLRVAFFAEPRWRDVLQVALPPGLALHTLELQPFDAGETYAYIHYRLNTAGLDGEPPFSAEELQRITRESGGVPARINAAARTVLVDAARAAEQPLRALPLWHFAVIAATLGALLLLYLWGAIEPGDAPTERPTPAPAVAARADTRSAEDGSVPTLQIAPVPEAADGAVDKPPQAPEDETQKVTPGIELAGASAVAAVMDPASALPPADADDLEMPAALGSTATASRASDEKQRNEETPTAPPANHTLAKATPADAGAATTAPLRAEPVPAATPKGGSSAAQAASPPAQAGTSAEFVYRPEGRAGGAVTEDERYLLGLDPGHFVLQIMGSDDGARVRAFAARSAVPLRLYRKLNNGREWYSLVHGEYASRDAAEKALSALPERLRDSRPWVRRLDTVQKEIRAARAI
jgi:DamX protein